MDLKHVNRRTQLGLWSHELRGLNEDKRRAHIAAQGRELAGLYLRSARNFQTIFEVAGIAGANRYEQTTHDIVLKHETDTVLGAGTVVAVLTAPLPERRVAPSTKTEVIFRTVGGDAYTMAEENFWTNSFAFGVSGQFLNPDHTWRADEVLRGSDELLPIIAAAEETQAMLWSAMQDPELNPGMAELAAEAVRTLYPEPAQ